MYIKINILVKAIIYNQVYQLDKLLAFLVAFYYVVNKIN